MGMFTDLINPRFSINRAKPVNELQKEEALKVGLELLYRSDDPNYNQYRHIDCGHVGFYQPTHIRRNNIRCSECLLRKHTVDAYTNGFTLLYSTGNSTYKYIRPCRHVSIMTPQNASEIISETCNQCFTGDLLSACGRNGYVYKHRAGGCYHTVGFVGCSHEKTTHHSQIFKGNIVCRPCVDIENKRLAELNGLIELSQEKC